MACTSTLVWFGNGLNPAWPLLWFAPLPIFFSRCVVPGVPPYSPQLFPFWPAVSICGIISAAANAVFRMVGGILYSRAHFRSGGVTLPCAGTCAALLAAHSGFPAAWVMLRILAESHEPHGTAGCLAYSQLNFLLFLELASITGPWGMTFVLFLFPAALAIGIHLRKTAPKQARRILGRDPQRHRSRAGLRRASSRTASPAPGS